MPQKTVKRLRDGGIETRYVLAQTLPWCHVALHLAHTERPGGIRQWAGCLSVGPRGVVWTKGRPARGEAWQA